MRVFKDGEQIGGSGVSGGVPDSVISVTPLPTMTVVGDTSVPQYRMAVRVREPGDVASFARTAPVGVVVYCLWEHV